MKQQFVELLNTSPLFPLFVPLPQAASYRECPSPLKRPTTMALCRLEQWKRSAEANANAVMLTITKRFKGRIFPYSPNVRVQDVRRGLRSFVKWVRLGLRPPFIKSYY